MNRQELRERGHQLVSHYKGPERRQNGGGDQFIIVRSWQTFLIVVGIVISSVFAFGTLRDTAAESERRIHDLEMHTLTIETYQAGQNATEQRLQRIENKLDAQDVREFTRDGKKASH